MILWGLRMQLGLSAIPAAPISQLANDGGALGGPCLPYLIYDSRHFLWHFVRCYFQLDIYKSKRKGQ